MDTKHFQSKFWRIGQFIVVLLISLTMASVVTAEPKRNRLGDIPLSDEAYQKHLKKVPREHYAHLSEPIFCLGPSWALGNRA